MVFWPALNRRGRLQTCWGGGSSPRCQRAGMSSRGRHCQTAPGESGGHRHKHQSGRAGGWTEAALGWAAPEPPAAQAQLGAAPWGEQECGSSTALLTVLVPWAVVTADCKLWTPEFFETIRINQSGEKEGFWIQLPFVHCMSVIEYKWRFTLWIQNRKLDLKSEGRAKEQFFFCQHFSFHPFKKSLVRGNMQYLCGCHCKKYITLRNNYGAANEADTLGFWSSWICNSGIWVRNPLEELLQN